MLGYHLLTWCKNYLSQNNLTYSDFCIFSADVSSTVLTNMSLRVPGGVYLMPPSGAPLSQSPGPPHNQNKPPAAVAIVTPQRSNSLDFLNFEEKRQLIASSLSLTDFLHHSGSATSPSSPTSGNVFIGELPCLHTCSNIHTA